MDTTKPQPKRRRGRPPKNKRDIYLPREGFTKREQVQTLHRMRETQYRVQRGICSCCDKPMDLDRSAWINCRDGDSLSKWAFCDTSAFDPVNLCHTFRPRSPAEIEAEYLNGRHELLRQGCVVRYRNTRYGHAGHTKGQEAEYCALLKERGFGDQPPPPGEAAQMWQEAQERLEARRKQHLTTIRQRAFATMKRKNPEWGTGAWRNRKKPPGNPSSDQPVGANWTTPDSDANLAAAQREEDERPETEDERGAREIIELATAAAKGG